MQSSLSAAQQAAIHATRGVPHELRPHGFAAVAVSVDSDHLLDIDALERKAEVLQIRAGVSSADRSADDEPADSSSGDRAVLWISNERLAGLRESISEFENLTEKGNPRYQSLVANMTGFEAVRFEDLWVDGVGSPPEEGTDLWELWYYISEDLGTSSFPLLEQFSEQLGLRVEHPVLQVGDYVSCTVEGSRENLEQLVNTAAMPVEIRRPSFIEELHEIGDDFVADWVHDFAGLLDPPEDQAPVVTVLDNGVRAAHPLLTSSLNGRVWSVVEGSSGDDYSSRHGTQMAGVALFGDLRGLLDRGTGERHAINHGLEAVRVLRGTSQVHVDHQRPGLLMVNAVSHVEIANPANRRVFLLAQTSTGGNDLLASQSLPTTWSTTLDALAMGCSVEITPEKVVVGRPEAGAQRLFCVSVGNLRGDDLAALGTPGSYYSSNLTRVAEEPSQAWNVLRIGAFTELDEVPASGHYEGWEPIAKKGGLSPYSRTGVTANKNHGAVPDIVLEGGNLLRSPNGDIDHPATTSVITTSPDSAAPLTHAFATSAATAQAARLAAVLHARYPDYWPETVRGLLVHRAEWTEHMAEGVHGKRNGTLLSKGKFDLEKLRIFGWGVPREESLLNSLTSDVTIVVQDRLSPFDKNFDLNEVKFYKLPWSTGLLEQLGRSQVEFRVTLSYFVEPNPGRRGKEHHSTYPSHGMQFHIKSGAQSSSEFHSDIARSLVETEKSGAAFFSTGPGWVAGPKNRDRGSLRTDMWRGAAHRLVGVDELAVVPLTGWWKTHGRTDRCASPAPFSLAITLKSLGSDVDIYTNVANSLGIATPVALDVEPTGQLTLDF
ncbi:S8 family peptidase [Arthrobacter sp. R3-55]